MKKSQARAMQKRCREKARSVRALRAVVDRAGRQGKAEMVDDLVGALIGCRLTRRRMRRLYAEHRREVVEQRVEREKEEW
jgi:hypothetical protein